MHMIATSMHQVRRYLVTVLFICHLVFLLGYWALHQQQTCHCYLNDTASFTEDRCLLRTCQKHLDFYLVSVLGYCVTLMHRTLLGFRAFPTARWTRLGGWRLTCSIPQIVGLVAFEVKAAGGMRALVVEKATVVLVGKRHCMPLQPV